MSQTNSTEQYAVKFKPKTNSAIYRRRIKRMVEAAKTLRDIPHGRKVSRGVNKVKKNASGPEKMAQDYRERLTLTMSTLHFFASPYPRSSGPADKAETPAANETTPAPTQK